MPTQPPAKPLPASTLLDDLHPARFLRVSDLIDRWKVQSITVTIAHITAESTIPNAKDIDDATRKPREVMQPVLYFKTKSGETFARGYLLSARADIDALKTAANAATVGETVGKQIKITVGTWKNKAVLRIDPAPVTATPTAAPGQTQAQP